jgi:hypothetical protein
LNNSGEFTFPGGGQGGGVDPPVTGELVPIHRFSMTAGNDGDHMFALSPSSDAAPSGYTHEGVHFQLFASGGDGRVPLYQSYCASCTDHLQGTQAQEGAPLYGGHTVLGYCYPGQKAEAPVELRRLYKAAASDHFVSASQAEIDALTAEGWLMEGGCWIAQ